MIIQEDTIYGIKQIRAMCNDNYIFELKNEIILYTHAPSFKDIIGNDKGTIKLISNSLEIYIAKKSRHSGHIYLIDRAKGSLKRTNDYRIIESKEDLLEEII